MLFFRVFPSTFRLETRKGVSSESRLETKERVTSESRLKTQKG